MPVNSNPEIKVKIFCPNCDEGETNTGEDCKECTATGFIEMPLSEWLEKHIKTPDINHTGFYTFNDMMKAFCLGTLAESGNFPHMDYIGAEGVINKYFKPHE